MATTVFANAVVNHPLTSARTVHRTSGGVVYVIYQDATNVIRCAKLTGGSFTEQNAAGATTGRVFNSVIDSNDVIHVPMYDTNDNVGYITFNTNTDTWSTDEDLGYAEETGYEALVMLAAVDANNIPHVVFAARTSGGAGNLNSVMYTNKIGGTWGTPRNIQGGPNSNEVYPHALTFDNSGFPVITYSSITNNDVRVVTMDATNGLTATLTDTQLQSVTIDNGTPETAGARFGGMVFDGTTRYISHTPNWGSDSTLAVLYEGATQRFSSNSPDKGAHQICLLNTGDLVFVYHSAGDIFYDVWDAVSHSFGGEVNLTNDGGLTPTFLSVTAESSATGKIDVVWYDTTDTDLVYQELDLGSVTGEHTGTIAAVTGAGEGNRTAAQRLAPDADDSVGSWSDQAGGTTNIYLTIDEAGAADDADYVRSETSPSASVYRCRLADPTGGNPDTSQAISVYYRARASSVSGTSSLTVRLKEGVTTRATWTESNVSDSWTNFTHDLSVGEKAAITDWTNLFLEFEATVT